VVLAVVVAHLPLTLEAVGRETLLALLRVKVIQVVLELLTQQISVQLVVVVVLAGSE
jgi:hypothetical protein